MTMLEKIELVLRKRGLSQAALERIALLPAGRISKWKDQRGEPTVRQALRIAHALDVPIPWLVDDGMDEPPPVSAMPSAAEQLAQRMVRALELSEDEVVRALSSAIAARSSLSGTPASAGRPAAGSPTVIGVGHPVEPRSGNPLSPPSSLHDRHGQDPKSRRGAAG
jgi:transcriptional regulator with XRE-family HTH domain